LRIYLPESGASQSYRAVECHLLRHAKPLHGLGVASVTRRDVAEVLARLASENGSVGANRTRASLQAFFGWAMMRGLVEQNPVVGTYKAPESTREHMLSMTELAAVWRACADDAYGAAIKMLILTGQRRDEIGSLRWCEVRDDLILLPAERTKNKRAHIVPLSAPALAILSGRPRTGELVFGGWISWAYGKLRLDAALAAAGAKLDHFVQHDLRRSVATHMAELGIAPHVIEAVLNHQSGHKAGVAGVYNRASYEREKRQALDLWADHLMAAIENREPRVVPLARHA
jgi:integrase